MTIFLLMGFLGCAFAQSQGGENQFDFIKVYTVKAPSGLVLRAEQSRKSARLDIIPYNTRIAIYSDYGQTEVIEGKEGIWMQTFWNNQYGFVFSGFLEAVEEQPIDMIINNMGVDHPWDCMQLDASKHWDALVLDKSYPNEFRGLYYDRVPLQIGKKTLPEGCGTSESVKDGVLNDIACPFAVFSGFPLVDRVRNVYARPLKLLPGEIESYQLYDPLLKKNRFYLLYVEGRTVTSPRVRTISSSYLTITSIEDYKVVLSELDPDNYSPIQSQVLYSRRITKPSDSDVMDMSALYIYFAGDLDGDNRLDLIIGNLTGFTNQWFVKSLAIKVI